MIVLVTCSTGITIINTVYAHPRQSHIAQAMLDHLRRAESSKDR